MKFLFNATRHRFGERRVRGDAGALRLRAAAQAALIAQGVSGTIDLHTVRPLDFNERKVVLNTRGEYNTAGKLNAGSDKLGYRVSGSYIDQFADGTIGVALGYAHLDSPFQEKHYKAWWWADTGAFGVPIQGMTFSVLGFGNVGSWAGRIFHDMGAKMTAVCDHTGAIHNERGINPHALAEHVQKTGGVAGFPNAEAITNEQFYRTKVDLFVPCALEQMIQEKQANWLNCRYVAEGANAPTTPAGDRVLSSKGVDVIPAILANAGGVTVSYFEWVQNKTSEYWDIEKVDRNLNKHMVMAARRTLLMREQYKTDLRTAAYIAALDNIAKAYAVRGIFP